MAASGGVMTENELGAHGSGQMRYSTTGCENFPVWEFDVILRCEPAWVSLEGCNDVACGHPSRRR